MPPQTNATLVRILAGSGAGQAPTEGFDDWDRQAPAPADPDGAGPAVAGEKWAAPAGVRAYYREKVDRVATETAVNVFTRRTVWVDTVDVPDELDTDDVVELKLDDGRTVTSTARTVARSSLPQAPTVSTTRIDLEDG